MATLGTSLSKSNWQFSHIHVSLAYLSDTLVSSSSMPIPPSLSEFPCSPAHIIELIYIPQLLSICCMHSHLPISTPTMFTHNLTLIHLHHSFFTTPNSTPSSRM